MGRIKANGIHMYYEIHGSGEPLVLIEGLGYATWMWYKQIERLSQHYKVIVFDNRGVGKTDMPDEEYTIELFAADMAELLDALGIKKAHILGVSMGGYVAQEFALSYPEYVDKLILCSTTFGGPNCIPIPEATLSMMFKGGGDYKSEDDIKKVISIALDEKNLSKHEDVLVKIMEEKMAHPQPKFAYNRQLMASAGFNTEERLCKVKAETLILAGRGDRVVPWENSQLIQNKIPHSRCEVLEGAGHVFFMEQPALTNKLIVDFLYQ
ncbi:alpha/beta hydrolase [Vallitalea pronyensis]|uniref:Alpha/beta hydrolase n=1 Tax=Vallitalea pronyensis TaxID=1348613 RepID=A0A8J8MLC5_9FIRM|nr:alpha/beta hydrolase [Vallitalea pronyensis]QUI23641.1 alpha/beta hydrolase [Vallitalea pronyensis]